MFVDRTYKILCHATGNYYPDIAPACNSNIALCRGLHYNCPVHSNPAGGE